MLQVKDVDAGYGDIRVLHNVSFHVEAGELVVLVGSNGAGKTTLMKIISSLIHPSKGRILFQGQRLDLLPPHKIAGTGIAHVPEGRQLFPDMSVRENLELGSLSPRAKTFRKKTLEWIFELFPILYERQQQPAGTLSGGEQQMCAIGRGLMSRPKLILFDEPSLGLSPLLTWEVFRMAAEIHKQGISLLMVEQNVKQTLGICDRAYVLTNGEIVLEGTGKELLENPEVKKAFLGI